MKKCWLVSLLISICYAKAYAQTPGPAAAARGAAHSVSFAAHVPVGVFGASHFAGAGLDYSWSRHRYGRNLSPTKPAGLTFHGGAEYYFGKKIKTAGQDFRYGGYIYCHAAGGIMVNAGANANISLTAGPTVGIYKGNAEAGLGMNLLGSYFINEKIAIGPGIAYKKHAHADALWCGLIRLSYIF